MHNAKLTTANHGRQNKIGKKHNWEWNKLI